MLHFRRKTPSAALVIDVLEPLQVGKTGVSVIGRVQDQCPDCVAALHSDPTVHLAQVVEEHAQVVELQRRLARDRSRDDARHAGHRTQLLEEPGELELTGVIRPPQLAAHCICYIIPEHVTRGEFDQEEVTALRLHHAAHGSQQVCLADTLLPLQHQTDRTRPGADRGVGDTCSDAVHGSRVQPLDMRGRVVPHVVRCLGRVEAERGERLALVFGHDSSITIRCLSSGPIRIAAV
ncbi:hypothetical protein AB0G02_01680 [Actinosynnema sp. NPDC023658]|uniref:hypothetical protein n=1 Tax=Actinosynnema sp. NPDC023658 TaxID=3155465 RepID=UPI0033F97D88